MVPTVPWHDAGVAYQMFNRFPESIAVVAMVWNSFMLSMPPLTPLHGGVVKAANRFGWPTQST